MAGIFNRDEPDCTAGAPIVQGTKMIAAISQYLDSIKDNLRLAPASEREVLTELEAHIEDELAEVREAGLSEDEAANACIEFLGSARMVARQIYEAHSQGTWRQVLY